MKHLSGRKTWILVVGGQWFIALWFFAALTPNANAKRCVDVPSLRVLATRKNAVSTNQNILKMLRHQGPSFEFPSGVKAYYLGSSRSGTKIYHLVYTVWMWDHGVRETDRLIFFSRNWRYLGNYGEIYYPPERICGNVLYWSYDPKIGNKIVLGKNGPPAKVVLNGEIYEFDNSKADNH